MPDATTLDTFLRKEAEKLRAKDKPPATREEWETRRDKLRRSLREAMGTFPDKDCPLEPKITGTLKRDGYSIEKLIFQSRPDVWVTANAYVPANVKAKVPAVLVVHGHWAGARRDPVVQARCLGLMKLGFFVLAVDAFGAGERYTKPALGTYHGALYGSTLWPTGHTLLGMQVYDNRRAVDYLLTRPEVDGTKLGVTGASGGGNQTMYAGAFDDRFGAVVPVCSVGTYQAYLHAACCVCEVLPGALKHAEEGEVLALVAPRALMVINATMDGFQFSVGEAKKSLERARPVFKLYEAEEKMKHVTFESPHAYNQAMREAMYGWMTRWLKGEGKGEPIPEPKHAVETWDDLACYPEGKRPKEFLLLPAYAGRAGAELLKKHQEAPKHLEEWEARVTLMRTNLRKSLNVAIKASKASAFKFEKRVGSTLVGEATLDPEPGVTISVRVERISRKQEAPLPVCLLLHLGDTEAKQREVLRQTLLEQGWFIATPELRGTGKAQPAGDAIVGASDHNSTEHALWVGRPLLGQWLGDIRTTLASLQETEDVDLRRLAIVGLGQAGVVAVAAAASLEGRFASATVLDAPVSFVTSERYAAGTRMGLLAPGILKVGDIPQLAALACPRKLHVIGGAKLSGGKIEGKELQEAFAFTKSIYALHKQEKLLTIADSIDPKDLVRQL